MNARCQRFGDNDVVHRYVAGTLEASDVPAFEEHLLECAACQSAVRQGVAVRASLGHVIEAAVQRADVPPRRRKRWIAIGGPVGLAAAAVLLLLIGRPSPDAEPAGPTHRAPIITGTVAPTVIGPVDTVDVVTSFVWAAVEGANLYEVVLYDADGNVWWEGRTRETFVLLPDSIQLEPGVAHYWTVRGRTGLERWVASELIEFTVKPRLPENR